MDDDDPEEGDGHGCCYHFGWGILSILDGLKVIAMVSVIIYFWIWTAENRLVDMDVIE